MASTWEKGLDFTFGVAVLTADALNQALATLVERGKLAQEHAPAVFDAIMEKGRPARENLVRGLREEMLHPMKGVPALDEIKALEERVASLEQQVNPAAAAASSDAGAGDGAPVAAAAASPHPAPVVETAFVPEPVDSPAADMAAAERNHEEGKEVG
jgi:polyhydroxyalkanoate synthesis regulator phasin